MTGTNCDLFTHNQSRSYLNHIVVFMYHPKANTFPMLGKYHFINTSEGAGNTVLHSSTGTWF
jgi:hypothetical protein